MRLTQILCLALPILLLAPAAEGQEKQTLRVADVYPAGHFVAEALTKPWMKEVEARTGGAVTFQYFPAEQLGKGKDLLSLTQSGVADIGLVIPAFVSDKLPLSAVAELPGGFAEACQGTMAFWKLANGGFLAEKEYAPNGVRVLFATVLPPYQIFSRTKLDSLKSFTGLKIYSTGGAKDLTVRKLGAVPIRMSTAEVFESLTRGTIDGGLMSYSTARAYNLQEEVHSATEGQNFGSGVITYVISGDRLAKLSPDVQKALIEAGDAVTRQACAKIQQSMQGDVNTLKEAGVEMMTLPDADRTKISEDMASVGQEWALELDKRGKSGTKALDAFHAALKASN
ncbi:TRAP-type C4-dicarboxylate transport system substrate-binding protein [Rhodoligotrophos appendicifer]|uniref:TRAP transporter substrate-binding protein n=1 Tax=Rhodoligotrophos appendicifer TaxID=987056 RepID=UPI001186A271|nr:TRAP transporter substrate-binding protein DctP [Rhodoligotrophos appendicifer]